MNVADLVDTLDWLIVAWAALVFAVVIWSVRRVRYWHKMRGYILHERAIRRAVRIVNAEERRRADKPAPYQRTG